MNLWEKVQARLVGISVWEPKGMNPIGRVGRNNSKIIRILIEENPECCICNEYLFIKLVPPRTLWEKFLFYIIRKPSFETNWGGTCGRGKNYCVDYYCMTNMFVDLEETG